MTPPNVLLSGVVGSTAYGLATPDSDIDRLGVFAAPTSKVLGLFAPKDSHVTTHPDVTLHEVGKFCRLCLGGNPTVQELLWLDDYETSTPLGLELVAIRRAFLSAPRVRAAYLGYARKQIEKAMARGDGSFSSDLRKRTSKHARHLTRLCGQGEQLYTTGDLKVRLDDPDHVREMGEWIAEDPRRGLVLIERTAGVIDRATSPLSETPDFATVEAWLLRVRDEFYEQAA